MPPQRGHLMELIVEARHPARETAASLDRPGDRKAARVDDDAGVLDAPPTRPYSFVAECECPDDCPRDHANE
jgi:hypothetical protein